MRLKPNELDKFKQTLLSLRAQLTQSVLETKEDVKEVDEFKGYSQHQADEGTNDFDRTISLELSNKEVSILKQIDRALEKIEDGSYGLCDVTGKEIPRARLEALPYATMTVEAQEKFEKGLL